MNKKFWFILVFIFSLFVLGYARGSGDYDNAEILINSNKNNEALEEIAQIFETKPESSEYAIKLVQKAMQSQKEFQDQFEALLNLLYEEPDNNEKKLALILELEQHRHDMNPDVEYFLEKLKISSIYALQRIRFIMYMEQGIAYINEKEYNKAADTFVKGYSIYNDKFQTENAKEKILDDVNKQINDVKDIVKKYKVTYENFIRTSEKLNTQIKNHNSALIEREFGALELLAKDLCSLIESTVHSGSILKNIYEEEAKQNKDIDETLLPFAYRLTIGRNSAVSFEGVEGAMEAGFFFGLDSVSDFFWAEIRNLFKELCDDFNFDATGSDSFDKNILHVNAYLQYLQKVYSAQSDSSQFRFVKIDSDKQNEKLQTGAALIENIIAARKVYSELPVFEKSRNIITEDYIGSAYDLRDEKNIRVTDLHNTANAIHSIALATEELFAKSRYHSNTGLDQEIELFKSKQNLILEHIASLRLNLFEQVAIIKDKAGETVLESSKKDYETWRSLIPENEKLSSEGISSKGLKSENIKTSPILALKELTALRKVVEKDIELLKKFTLQVAPIGQFLNLSDVFSKHINGVNETISNLRNLSSSIKNDITYSNTLVIRIQLAKDESDLRYEQARQYLKKGNFNAAREHIELSRIKTDEALQLESNDEYLKMTDERLYKLGTEINDAENAVVIRDVRNYLDAAKKHYFNGEFQSAEDALILARNRWAVTHVELNEEVTNWLSIVSTADFLKTGRTVPLTAPLYPQIVQLLNNATQLYTAAAKKINSAERETALQNLNDARENIKQVLLVYPFNETAGQLNLKIDKLLDPKNFNTQFSRKLVKIKQEYKINSQRSYSDLLDLYSIDKRFPGIAALKDEIEIYLGIKMPPPDFKAIAESKQLTESARKIFASRNTFDFPLAVQQLDRAIKLNIENIEAVRLKDEIQMNMGGGSVIVLSAANEAKYRQAVSEMIKGNKIIAAALVEQLMQDKNAKNSAKVRELKKRIDAQL